MICPNCRHKNRATAKFCDNCGHRLAREDAPNEREPALQSPFARLIPGDLAGRLEQARLNRAMEGERRIVTMLFCDVKGSTAAAETMDPEDWAEVMNGAFEHMIPPIYRYEGTVARLMGDAILAFFGAPIAHEDDPRRAVLAGLEIVAGIAPYRRTIKRRWGFDFDVRVGINTGLVMVGAVGSNMRMEYTAMGDAINLAARMEQTAAPGSVQISQETYRHAAPYFEFESLGPIQVKGKSEPVRTYRPLRRKAAPGKVRGIAGLEAPLIGRQDEKNLLVAVLAGLKKGKGAIAFLVGEAGLGKSRLIQEIQAEALGRAAPAQPAWFETFSYSYETEQPYGLFRRLVRRMIGGLPDEGSAGMRGRIESLAAEFSEDERPTAQRVFESLFGLAGTGGQPPLEGETFKGLLYTTMGSLWQRRARAKPVVLVCDDLHWSDPASLALLGHLFPLVDRNAIMFFCALRPGSDSAGWGAMQAAEGQFVKRFQKITLRPLKAGESGQLVDSLLAISDLPQGLRALIMAKSEGNPFFVEEVVRSLIDQGLVVRDAGGDRWQAAGEGQGLEIPGNLQTLLVARIDRLEERPRWTLQIASVVGRTFYHRVLQRVVDEALWELDQNLSTLEHTQLIREASRVPELEYAFRHALTQEAAYSTILRKQRRAYHHRVGQALEALFPDHLEEWAGALAEHFFKSRAFEKSLDYAILAGDAAFRLYALQEAIEHYQRAIECAGKGVAGDDQLIHIYTHLGRSYELDHQNDQALETYREMARLAEDRDHDPIRLAALTARCILQATHTSVFDPPKARELGAAALALAQKLGDRAAEARALWGLMQVAFSSASGSDQVTEYGNRALSIAGELGLDDLRAFILGNFFWLYMGKFQFAQAQQAADETETIWKKLGNLPMLADTNTLKTASQWTMGQYDAGLETAAENLRLSQSIGNVWNQRESLRMLGVLHSLKGQFGQALERFNEIHADPQADPILYQGYANSLIEFYYAVGALDEAERIADELYALRNMFMPLFAPFFFPTIARVKISRGKLQECRHLLDQAWQRFNPESPLASLKIAIVVAEGHLDLALENPQAVFDPLEQEIRILRAAGVRYLIAESLWLQGKAQMALGNVEQARAKFQDARAEAEGIGERITLWRILADFSELERALGNNREADEFRDQALEVIETIAGYAPPELRAKFLAQPEVRKMTEPESRKS